MSGALPYGFEGDRKYSGFYKHSGRITPLGVILGVVAGVATAIVASIIYAYADLYIPIVYANILLCLCFGAAMGFVPAAVMRWGKVRNVPVTLAIAFVLTLIAYYICWVVWMSGVIDRYTKSGRDFSMLELLFSPRMVFQLAQNINAVGTWSLGKYDKEATNGIFLAIIWLGEAICIFGAAFLTAKTVVSDRPFCERCNQWCSREADLASISATDVPATKQMILDHRFQDLGAVGGGQRDHWIALAHHGCDNCKQFHTLSASEVRVTVDKQGKETPKKNMLINRMLVSAQEVDQVRGLRAKPTMSMAAPVLGMGAPPPTTVAPPPLQSPAPISGAQPARDSDVGIS